MNDRKHCPQCDVHYANEALHLTVHDAIVDAMLGTAGPVREPAPATALPAAS